MIIYNVTIKVDHSIADEWIIWLKKEHIHEVIRTDCFTEATILRLLDVDEEDGVTYAIQYHTSNFSHYKSYIDNHAEKLRKKGMDRWGNKFIAFRSVMEVVY